jgi:hypothetical protein
MNTSRHVHDFGSVGVCDGVSAAARFDGFDGVRTGFALS